MNKQIIKFNSIQISEFLSIVEKHGLYLDVESDAQASAMFSELLIEMTLSLDTEQVEAYSHAL